MAKELSFGSTTLTERLVLLGLAEASFPGDEPVDASSVRASCTDHLDEIDADVVGKLSDVDVVRALNQLEADGWVTGARDEESAVGKGRPTYVLVVDPEEALGELESDERIAPVVEHVRDALA